MTFQFQCPYGHLLQGEESQAGQQCACPMCNTLFIIPAPLAPASPVAPQFTGFHSPPEAPQAPATFPEFDGLSAKQSQRKPPALPEPAPAPEPEPASSPSPGPQLIPNVAELLHIGCPNGHILETPAEMLDQEVLCPHCQAKFVLRRQNSEEYKKKKRDERARKERRKDQAWIIWAVIVVVAVLAGLGYLIVHSTG